MGQTDKPEQSCRLDWDGKNLTLIIDGERVAQFVQRGGAWMTLEPEFTVFNAPTLTELILGQEPVPWSKAIVIKDDGEMH